MPCCLFQIGPGCIVQIESVKITICDSVPFASKMRCPRTEALARLPCDGTQRERTVKGSTSEFSSIPIPLTYCIRKPKGASGRPTRPSFVLAEPMASRLRNREVGMAPC
jgi:hypothetical protein